MYPQTKGDSKAKTVSWTEDEPRGTKYKNQ